MPFKDFVAFDEHLALPIHPHLRYPPSILYFQEFHFSDPTEGKIL